MKLSLNRELKDLFFCLLRESDWITGEALAEKLGWNLKKVRQNIRWLTDDLGGLCRIESQKSKGYLLVDFSDELKADILQDIFYNGCYFNLNERRSMLILALLFETDYTSMDSLAERFFLSKTVVFEEIRNIKRWFERIGDLELEVSPRSGVMIHGSEKAKRYCCASFTQLNILKLLGFEPAVIARYQASLKSASPILRRAVQSFCMLPSGQDFLLLLRYIAITQMRSEMGFALEAVKDKHTEKRAENFFDELDEAVGYAYSAQERQLIWEFLCYFNVTASDNALINSMHTDNLEACIMRRLNMSGTRLFENRVLLGQSVESMLYRLPSDIHTANYYDKEILSCYPLAIHLVCQSMLEIYGEKLPRTDCLDMAAYLGAVLDNLRCPSQLRILLAGNQNRLLLEQLGEYIKGMLPLVPARFDILPCYVLNDNTEDLRGSYDLLLTTEPEIVLKNNGFLLVSAVVTENGRKAMRTKMETRLGEYNTSALAALQSSSARHELDKLNSLDELLPTELLRQATVYALNKDTLVIIYTSPTAETGVQEYTLRKSFAYEYRAISKILIAQYNEKEPWIIEFFKVFAMYIQKS